MFFDAESGLVVDANPAACALYGYSRDELIGTSMMSRSGSPERLSNLIPDLRAGGNPTRHFFTIDYCRNGTEICLEVSASLVRHRGQDLVVAFHRDVTEKAVLAQKLVDAAGEWQLTVDAIQAAILLVG